jgi:DNA invertase Pin-like site-specific DNA recombinase
MSKAVEYLRVSSEEQLRKTKAVAYIRINTIDMAKAEGQLVKISEYANKNGFEVVKWYIDTATSGLEKEPPMYNKMVKEAESKVIIVTQPDRISRDMMLLALRLSRLSKKGISVHSVESGELK